MVFRAVRFSPYAPKFNKKMENFINTKNLPMLMSIRQNDKSLFDLICKYYALEQKKFGRTAKQIEKDIDQLTCIGSVTIRSMINIDNTSEGRAYFAQAERQHWSTHSR